MKKIITLLFITSLLLMNNKKTYAQVGIEEINFQLRDLFQHLKRSPDSLPFLYEMSSHVIDEKLYRPYNDSDYISKGMFLTMYQEMRAAAYDTSILEHVDVVDDKMRKRSRNDTVNIAILNADYSIFMDNAFTTDGQFYNLTDSTISDVPNRAYDPFLSRNVFVSTLTTPVSYFRKVYYRVDSTFVFSKKELGGKNNRDLDPNYARWKIDFGEGLGWREFNPLSVNHFVILYPDTGVYDLKIAVFYCDPYPNCNSLPDKLSKTSIYILNNAIPKEPDLTYEFGNVITVGLYKGCGETRGGMYIPQKPFIIVEGIDLLNTRSIPVLYDENVKITSSKKLGLLAEYNYDFYIVNFNDTHLDMRENAKGIVQLIDYLKSIMNTNEQFVVFAESMGGIIARYALTYMENDAYTQDPLSNKPAQMHNTRLYISNDAPHQGATVPASVQSFYRNTEKSIYYKAIKGFLRLFPVFSNEKFWNDALDYTSVQQLLAYHIDTDGPHRERIDFMNDLIALNPQTNGYPAYTKMMAFTDGLLSGQSQLKLDNTILNPGDNLFELDFMLKVKLLRKISFDILKEEIDLRAVDASKPYHPINIHKTRFLVKLKFKGCLRSFLRGNFAEYIKCGITYDNSNQVIPSLNITSNYDTEAAGFFSILSILYDNVDWMNFDFKILKNAAFMDMNTGEFKSSLSTSKYSPFGFISSPEIHARLKISSIGFAFIPVHSAIDFDYYKTLNISTDYNLLQHNVQDFLLAYSPFHVISGFNYTDVGYPKNASEKKNSKNWSHGFINNMEIINKSGEYYLNREIGDSILYLNNLDLGLRNADFNSIIIRVGTQNEYYNYASNNDDSNSIKFVYSKADNFKFREPSVVKSNYQNIYFEGQHLSKEGLLIINQKKFTPCNVSHKRLINIPSIHSIYVYPNPFHSILFIEKLNINTSYKIDFINVLGQVVLTKQFFTYNTNSYEVKTDELENNSLYFINMYENNKLIGNFKLIKN